MTKETYNKLMKLISKQILSHKDLQELEQIAGVKATLLNTLFLSQYRVEVNGNTYYVYVNFKNK